MTHGLPGDGYSGKFSLHGISVVIVMAGSVNGGSYMEASSPVDIHVVVLVKNRQATETKQQ